MELPAPDGMSHGLAASSLTAGLKLTPYFPFPELYTRGHLGSKQDFSQAHPEPYLEAQF
jgi:hypothetical protein